MEKKADEKLKKGVDYTGIVITSYAWDGAGKFFVTQRSEKCRDEHGVWECPGGGLKFAESPEDCLRREIREEVGAETVEIMELLGVNSFVRENDGKKTHWIRFSYICKVDPKEIHIGEPDMVAGSGWYGLDNIPLPHNPGLAYDLEHHQDALQKYTV